MPTRPWLSLRRLSPLSSALLPARRFGFAAWLAIGLLAMACATGCSGQASRQASVSAALPRPLTLYPVVLRSASLAKTGILAMSGGARDWSGWGVQFVGGATGWCEFSNATNRNCKPAPILGKPVPTANGFLLANTLLEGRTIVTGSWAGRDMLHLPMGTDVSVVARYFAYRVTSHTYTYLGQSPESSSLSGPNSYVAISIPPVRLAAARFTTGDRLYIDYWAHVRANTATRWADVYLQTSASSTIGRNEDMITTPGYTPLSSDTRASTVGIPSYDHIVVIIMENHSYGQIIGNTAEAPYINELMQHGALAANYLALTRTSLPNYLALTGGNTFGLTADCTGCMLDASNLADRLEAAGKTWKAYMESMPAACYLGDKYPYVQRHNPFVYYTDIQTNGPRCAAHDVPYSQLTIDLQRASTTPNFVLITPNVIDDMHDGTISQGDTWLSQQVPAILRGPAFTQQHSLLVLTWDEQDEHDSNTADNHIATILVGYGTKIDYPSSVTYTHYSLLRTIEGAWGLAPLASNDQAACAMTDLLQHASGAGGAAPVCSIGGAT
jgi:phosphatidylinositol-3-phosphatase